MYLGNKRSILLLFCCFIFFVYQAQTLYWVGGSGNFNDPKHWSLSSGGLPSNIVPSQNNDVVFDDNSASELIITIEGKLAINSLRSYVIKHPIIFKGQKSSLLHIAGSFELSPASKWNYLGDVLFETSSLSLNKVSFGLYNIPGNLKFGLGKYYINSVFQNSGAKTHFENGTYIFKKTSLSVSDLIITGLNTSFIIDTTFFLVKNKLLMANSCNFITHKFAFYAPFSNNSNTIPKNITFGNDTKLTDNSVMATCGATVVTIPECSGSCSGIFSYTIDPSCSNPPYNILVTNNNLAINCQNTSTLLSGSAVPMTNTINGACDCPGQQYNLTIFDNIGFPIPLTINGGLTTNFGFPPPSFGLATFTSLQPTCNSSCNGTITLIASGGLGPYTITVLPAIVPPITTVGFFTLGALCANIYTFTITDKNGCAGPVTKTITAPAPVSTGSVATNVLCNTACTGSLVITPTGGNPGGYTVSFSPPGGTFVVPASGSASVTNLCPGPISATVTDSKGCTAVTNTIITQPPALTVTATQTNVSCGGLCNGAASISVSGGVTPYSYTWSPGSSNTNSITNLCVGTQTVSIKDFNNCNTSHSFTITSPPPITITPTFTNASCSGLCNGKASVTGSGGTGAISFTWVATGPSTVATNVSNLSNLCAGAYTVFAKDAAGCTSSITISVTQPTVLSVTASSQSITCIGICNGLAIASPVGGNGGPFNYTWTPSPPFGQGTATISNICNAGVYSVSITDASLCPISTTIAIIQPPGITANITTGSLSCNGVCTGSINASPTGPTGPYTYILTSSSSTINAPPPYINLCAGSYTLSIGYGVGCVQLFTVNILQPNPLLPSISSTSLTCFNSCNGTLAGSVLGGTPVYNFVWTTPTGTASGGALAGQCAGNYTFNVTDAKGCTATATTVLAQPPNITVAITSSSPLCFGLCNSVLSANISGGTPGYTLSWSNGFIGNPNPGLCAGNYTLTVLDAKGCITTATTAVIAPTSLTLTQTTTSTSCAGICDGSATITTVGGAPPYTFQFNTLPITTNTTGVISSLCAGNYIANVTDANSCSQSINFSISSPVALSAAVTGIQSSCNACTGSATVTPSNGTPAYSYVWTNSLSATVGTNAAVGSLCPGSYTATVLDSKGCAATATANIVQTVSVTVVTAGTVIKCFGICTGSATANALGGTLPYTYIWNPTAPLQTSQTATSLCAGTYTVLVSDQLGCSNTGTVTFTNPPNIVTAPTQTNVNCFGSCNGAINSNASGGTGALSYSWSPGTITTPNNSGLCAGNYTLKITDANNCSNTQTFTIANTTSISATFTTTNPSACVINNGGICATPSGGTGAGYTYTWSPSGGAGGNSNCYTNLTPGPYTLLVADGAGCSTTLSAILTNPNGPTLTINSQSVTCFGANTGAATVTAIGSGPFTFTWSPAIGFTTIGNTSTASSLNTGTYNISVTDMSSGCITTQSIAITQPSASLTANSIVTNAKCSGACNGSITIAPSGGTPNYTYNWLPLAPPITGQGTATITNLCAGNYSLIINDANSCSRQFTFVITQPLPLVLNASASNVLCNSACNGTANVTSSGGTSPVTYTWLPVGTFTGSTNSIILNLCPNTYTVNGSDLNNCLATQTIQVTQPTSLSSTVSFVNASCSNSCNASASLTVGGGTPTYSFSWSTGTSTSQSIGSLCAGNYIGTVVDANGCSSSKSFTITAPSSFNVTLTPTNPLCNAACNGSITTVLSGNQGLVSYNWISSGSGQNPTNLCAGNYTLIATDASGCIASGVTSILNPPGLLANVSTTNPACNGSCNGVAISSPVNAIGPVNYTWSPAGLNSSTLASLCAGNYTVSIQDNNGCKNTQTFTLNNPPLLNVNSSIASAVCGLANGSITAIATGGTPAYTYSWSAPVSSTNAAVTGLAAGIYTVVVKDANNCTNTLTIPISNSNGPSSAPITSSSITCNGQCTGAASVNIGSIIGGTPGYTVTWLSPPSSSSINPQTNLCAGSYTVQINDNNNCLLFNSVTIAQPSSITISPNLTFPTCNGSCNGSITLNATGGTGAYSYSWTPGTSSTQTLLNACAANYTIVIGDANLCLSTQTVNLPAVQNMVTTPVVTANLCFGNCNATASITSISGGISPITYLWSNSQTGPVATNLCNGIYTVTATDALGCFNNFTTSITSPNPISILSAIASPSCNLCNGSSTVVPTGGTAPYSYSWTSGSTSSSESNLCAGLYQVLVTDNNLCTQLQNVMISNSNGITGDIPTVQNEICAGQCNGAATVVAVGGNPPITYNWLNPPVTNSVITNLCMGTYFVQMTDVQGCIRTSSVSISAATQLTITPTIIPPSCAVADGTISVVASGGVPSYSYTWLPAGNSSSLTNIAPGNYTLTVTDNTGCSKTQAFNVSSLNAPAITFTQNNIGCFNACTGAVLALGTSTSGSVTYSWSNGSTLANISNLCKGIVTLTVSAPNGCKNVQSFTLTDNPVLQLSNINLNQPLCHNDCNGAITLIPSGGVLPYSYTWLPSGSSNPLSSLCPGISTAPIIYSVTITDSKGCTISTSTTLINPTAISLTPTFTNASCSSVNDGILNIGVTGGTPAYTYTWSGPSAYSANTQNISSLFPGTYSLSLTDNNGCRRDTILDVIPTVSIVAQAGNDVTVCPTPSVTLTGTNSFGAVSYDWFLLPNNTSTLANTVTFLAPTPLTAPGASTFVLLTTSSVTGCVDRDTVIVNIYALPFVDAGPTVTIPVYSTVTIGGNPTASGSYTLNWLPSFDLDDQSVSNPVASNTINTTYTVTVKDLSTGCINSDTMTVFLYPLIKIPNGFSPNGDTKNEKWIIDYIDQFPNNTVEVYNRWGELLFYSQGYNIPFDGRYKGKNLPVGTYYYVININHPAYPKPYTGPLTIFR